MKENVMIVPQIKDQNLLARYYSMADVFVICSKRENFPTTCIEAQCCGTPVVGFDTGGAKETSVLTGDDFVAYGDLKGLARRVQEKIGQDTSDLAMKACEAYAEESMARRYLKVYDKGGRKERVLLLDVNCKYSSTGKIVYSLYQDIRKEGRKSAVCYGRGKTVVGKDIYKFGLNWETNVHAGLSRVTGYNGCFSPLSTYRLIQFVEAYKPDLVHLHELHAYFMNLALFINYMKQKRIPVVWTFHCEYMYTGKCGHAYDCPNFLNGCGNCPAVKDYPKSLFFDRTRQMMKKKRELLRDLDFTVVAPSQWLADRVKLTFLKDKAVEVIHNGIDTKIFHSVDSCGLRKSLGIPEGHKVVLAVAPDILSETKGGRWVLKLAEVLKDKKIMFVLVGAKKRSDIYKR